MSKKNKIIFTVFSILSLGIFVGYQYIYKEHRDISSEEAKFEITSNDLNSEYSLSSEKANQKFLDKTIIISGILTSVDLDGKTFVIDDKVTCNSVENTNIKIGENLTVKGRFIGYDELLEEYRLDECIVISNK